MSAHLDLDDVAADHPLALQELTEIRKNAERYLWLRANMIGVIHLIGRPGIGLSGVTGDGLDAQVDAAMQAGAAE
jgi:hypothetical protein